MKNGNLRKIAGQTLALIFILMGLSACSTTDRKPPQPSAAKVEQQKRTTVKATNGGGANEVEENGSLLGISKVRLRSRRGERLAEF